MSVLVTSTLVTATGKEVVKTARASKDGKESKGEYPNLAQVLCIQYSITFQKKFVSVSVLFDSGSEINVIYPIFAWELRLPIKLMDVRVQKIDSIMLDIFGIVIIAFSVTDKANWVEFFEESFLVTNVSPKVIFRMLFLTLSGADIYFLGQKFRWRTYTIKKALLTTRRIELVGKKKFAATV